MESMTNFPTVPVAQVPLNIKSSNGGGRHRPVVLVVDDERVIADTLAAILTKCGFAAMTAYDGPAALEIAALVPPELVITDVMMPGMTGIDLAIQLRASIGDCAVILFSGSATTADLLATAKVDGHEFVILTKPVHPADLLARVKESFMEKRAFAAAVD
jgi:DNA-binding response OmpR family regulator